MTFCHATAGNGAIFRTHERTNGGTHERTNGWTNGRTNGQTNERTDKRTDGRTNGWTDKRGSRNNYLDYCIMRLLRHTTFTIHDASAQNFVHFDTQYDTVCPWLRLASKNENLSKS